MGVLTGLAPERVFYYFEEISNIPHGSGNTKEISDYIAAFAASHALEYQQDAAGNVVIRKAASAGKEGSAPVMLQGHMDMVAACEADCNLDMASEGLRLKVQDGRISADGTTLGGDDGIAVAYMLALLEAQDLAHPPLECVFTVDEEIGMLGAFAMDMSVLKARRLINLDSEQEGVLCVSCAGGVVAVSHLPVTVKPASDLGVRVTISGCTGGHSGEEIVKQRANPIHLIGRYLFTLKKHTSFRMVSICGGTADNAIPNSAQTVITLPDEEGAGACFTHAEEMTRILREEFRATDPDITISCEAVRTDGKAFDASTTYRVGAAIYTMPDGVQKMSAQVPGLVQTSLNLGVIESGVDEVRLNFCVRSSLESEKTELTDRIRSLTAVLGGYMSTEGDYPGMAYLEHSPLRDVMTAVYEEQYGEKPRVEAVHAGLECGLFAGNISGLDYVSIGPDMKGIHTPAETLDIASVQRVWKYLTAVLAAL